MTKRTKFEIAVASLKSKKKIPFDNRHYLPAELITKLAKEVRALRANQCVPSMRCLFEYEDYIDKIYGEPGD